MRTIFHALFKGTYRIALFIVTFSLVWVLQFHLMVKYPYLYGLILDEFREISNTLVAFTRRHYRDFHYIMIANLNDELGPKNLFLIGLSGVAGLLVGTVEACFVGFCRALAAIWRKLFGTRRDDRAAPPAVAVNSVPHLQVVSARRERA